MEWFVQSRVIVHSPRDAKIIVGGEGDCSYFVSGMPTSPLRYEPTNRNLCDAGSVDRCRAEESQLCLVKSDYHVLGVIGCILGSSSRIDWGIDRWLAKS